MKIRSLTVFLCIAVSLTGCGALRGEGLIEKVATFVATNSSDDTVSFFINGGLPNEVAPNSTRQFEATILVEAYSTYSPTQPTNEKIVDVSVSVKIHRTGELLPSIRCQSGVQVLTDLRFEINRDGRGRLTCRLLDTW